MVRIAVAEAAAERSRELSKASDALAARGVDELITAAVAKDVAGAAARSGVAKIAEVANEMGKGQGRLNIVNINGETDLNRLAKLDLMQGLELPAAKPARASRAARYPKVPAMAAEGHGAEH